MDAADPTRPLTAPTPIAWLSLTYRKPRLAAALSGVAFASVLMFLEMGFRNGLFDSQTNVIRQLDADLVIVHEQKEAFVPQVPFPRRRVLQARAVPGVEAAYPVYVEEYRGSWKNSTNGREYPILVFGINPDDPVFLIPEVKAQVALLKEPDTAIVDSRSRDFYGEIRADLPAELSRRAVRIVGTFPLGPDFRIDGNVIVSDRTFFNTYGGAVEPSARESLVEFGLLKVVPGADIVATQRAVADVLPDDVRVLTRNELADLIQNYWSNSKPVGAVFGLGMVVGFLIGVTICYQILYTDVVDHLPQYATLKALGYHNNHLVRIVLQKALYLGALGFVPGLIVSLLMYAAVESYSGILMRLTIGRTLIVLIATMAMCLVSGAIAIRRVIQSDPAEVF